MNISISGIPGTGKSTVAKLLEKKLDANLIDIKKLVNSKKIKSKYDKKRKTRIIENKDLRNAVKKELSKEKDNIIESHLSHLIKSDIFFILRTNPTELKKRLKKRKWSKAKIRENIEAEFVDEITIETLNLHKKSKIYEIDTSKKKPGSILKVITKVLKRQTNYRKYYAGKINWNKYSKELI